MNFDVFGSLETFTISFPTMTALLGQKFTVEPEGLAPSVYAFLEGKPGLYHDPIEHQFGSPQAVKAALERAGYEVYVPEEYAAVLERETAQYADDDYPDGVVF